MAIQRTNADVAAVFVRLANYLEIAGENPFKTRAYRRAAEVLLDLSEPVAIVAAENRLDDLPGFGEAIVAKTKDILETGTTPAYEKMRAQIPESVLDFLELPGVGVKTVQQLWEGLGAANLDELEAAARSGRVRALKGMSEKTEARILAAIEQHRRNRSLILADEAERTAIRVMTELGARGVADRIELAGQARRGCETVSSLDLVTSARDPAAALEAASALACASAIAGRGKAWVRIIIDGRAECTVTACDAENFGAVLARRTGSAAHIARLADRGLDLEGLAARTEDEFYAALGLPFIPPQLREDRGEIEAAEAGRLPVLVRIEDIRGNLHQHTDASDGRETLEQMAMAGKKRGYEYMAITDHSRSLVIANGLSVERLREQMRAVRDMEQQVGIRLLTGTEVDILGDGSLDFPDEVLAELDVVVASVHSRFSQPEAEMTARIVRAVSNPHVDILGHPTGRLLGGREPYAVDIDAVVAAAKRSGAALEINAFPDRLDLNEENARKASEAGVMVAIGADAHRAEHLDLMRFGVSIAQRAWLGPDKILNARPLPELIDWLRR